MSSRLISRRTLLRGMLGGSAVALALPWLESMGVSVARGAPVPRRFGVWFWGNGVRREHWIPATTGTDYVMPEELRPLMGVRSHVSVLTGLEIKTATHPHHSGMAGILSGAPHQQVGVTRDTIVSTFAQPSLDQVAAQHIGGETPFRSLEVGVCKFRGTDEGTTFQHLSHNGPNNVNASEYSAERVFQRLFGVTPSQQILKARQSVLDAVGTDIQSVQRTVSASDRIRLDQHLTSIREIEKRLAREVNRCAAPLAPTDVDEDGMGRERIEDKNRLMSDLIALALACDLTRVFSVLFSSAGSGVVVWQAGATDGLHLTCHTEAAPQPIVHRATVFNMQQLAYFLGKLRDTPEQGGNLLDSCSIVCTTELSEGNTHTNDEFPILLAGRAGGRLKSGRHVRSTTKANTSLALLTALRAAGCNLPEFGTAGGRVTSTLSELEA